MADEVDARVMNYPAGDVEELPFDHEGSGVIPYPTEPASKLEAVKGFVDGFGLPEGSTASDVLQHIMTQAGHKMTFVNILAIAYMMGADIQLVIYDKADLDMGPAPTTEGEVQ